LAKIVIQPGLFRSIACHSKWRAICLNLQVCQIFDKTDAINLEFRLNIGCNFKKKILDNRGLLFIPDISGFTKFVNDTEINHSRLIIQELLEVLISCNQIGLEVSEIEGDAILFYKYGECPDLDELYKQVEKMFCEFHKSLIAYDHLRFCQCRACISAVELSLKVVTHYGEFTGYNVRNFSKLIGKDVIIAHQLLKNNIQQHEYWLVTKDLLRDKTPARFAGWMEWDSSVKETESGVVPFHYTQLGQLKDNISPDPFPQLGIQKKVKVFTVSKEYETDIITLVHGVGDFNYRHLWKEGVTAVEEINHFLPRIGTRCRCIMDNGQSFIYASSYFFSPDHIEFSETDEKKKNSYCYILDKMSEKKTMLTVDFYMQKNFFQQLFLKFGKKRKMRQSLQRSLQNLARIVKDLHIPSAEHVAS
jgi:hypothetical protein